MTVDLTEMGASGGLRNHDAAAKTHFNDRTKHASLNLHLLRDVSGFFLFSDMVQKLHHRGSSRRLTTMTLKYTLRGAETRL